MFLTHPLLREELPVVDCLKDFSAWSLIELAPVRVLYFLEVQWGVSPAQEGSTDRSTRRYLATRFPSLAEILENVGQHDQVTAFLLLQPNDGGTGWSLSQVVDVWKTLLPGGKTPIWVLKTSLGERIVEHPTFPRQPDTQTLP